VYLHDENPRARGPAGNHIFTIAGSGSSKTMEQLFAALDVSLQLPA
jgi:hypothetical protein